MIICVKYTVKPLKKNIKINLYKFKLLFKFMS